MTPPDLSLHRDLSTLMSISVIPDLTYKETIHTGALASAKGGFTSVICMANTSPTVDSVPVLRDNLERASKEKIRIFQAASISQSERPGRN